MRRAIGVALGLTVAACQPRNEAAAASSPAHEDAAIEQEITAVANGVMDAANALDEEGSFGAFSTSPPAQWASQGVAGEVQPFREGWRAAVANMSRQSLEDRRIVVQVLAPDIAASTMTGVYSSADKAGVESPKTRYAWTAVWQRQDAQWKMIAGHQSLEGGFADEQAARR